MLTNTKKLKKPKKIRCKTFKDGKVYLGDCLELMKRLPDKSIDMILCDLPYGTTACKWDTIISLDLLWKQYIRLIKNTGVIVLNSAQPFTTTLIHSKKEIFKYCWIWVKNSPTGFQHAPNRPMMKHEEICIFSKAPMGHKSQLKDRRMLYNPQGVSSCGKNIITEKTHGKYLGKRKNQVGKIYEAKTGYPQSLLNFDKEKKYIHPTQKPVALFEYLIKTYTNAGDLVLDNCAGSGTTGIACQNLGRKFILMEKEEAYYGIIKKRLKKNEKEKRKAD